MLEEAFRGFKGTDIPRKTCKTIYNEPSPFVEHYKAPLFAVFKHLNTFGDVRAVCVLMPRSVLSRGPPKTAAAKQAKVDEIYAMIRYQLEPGLGPGTWR